MSLFDFDPFAEVPELPDECELCYEENPTNEWMAIPDCGHYTCKTCFTEHLKASVEGGQDCVQTPCPNGCRLLVPSHLFEQVLPTAVYSKYLNFLTESYVWKQKDHYKQCSGADCEAIIKSTTTEGSLDDYSCSECQQSFCFQCQKTAHQPMDCALFETWHKRSGGNEEDNSLWIKINTKPCPSCKVAI